MTEKACVHEFYWYPAINEEGWRCCLCKHQPGEPPGFSPRLDVDLIEIKVGSILMDLADAKLICVSNGSHGESIGWNVAQRCKKLGRFDQSTIVEEIFRGDRSHGVYWRKISRGILKGKDPRNRCVCGTLANIYSGGKSYCGECHPDMKRLPI